MTEIEYVKFDPFNVACYDMDRDTIYIDRRFKDNKILSDYLIEHEMRHAKSQDRLDIGIELSGFDTLNEIVLVMEKPLYALSVLVPITAVYKDGRWDYGMDYFRVLFLLVMAAMIVIIGGNVR